MVDSLEGDDITPQSPQEAFDPFQPLASQISQLESVLNVAFEDYGGFISRMATRVLDMPPEQRFTESIHEVRDLVEEEFGSADIFRSKFPFSEDQLNSILNKLFDQLLREILSGVFVIREPEDHLLLASAVQELKTGIEIAHASSYDDGVAEQVDKEQLVSALSAIWARVYSIRDGAKSERKDQVARDVVQSFYYRTDSLGEPELTVHPDEMDTPEAHQFVREYGAIVVYASLDITVSRGAELANLSEYEFKSLLQRRDVPIRYGPESVDDLNEDSMLHEQ